MSHRDGHAPHGNTGEAIDGQQAAPRIGHNSRHVGLSFDEVVEEALRRGVYLTHVLALCRCIEDPRLSPRHRLVLAKIVERTTVQTAVAFPGRARLAADIIYFEGGTAKRYTEATIAKTIHELCDYGYLAFDRRAPKGGGRPLAHYVVRPPTIAELEAAIATYCARIRGSQVVSSDDVTSQPGNVTSQAGNVTSKSPPEVTLPSRRPTVTGTLSLGDGQTFGGDTTADPPPHMTAEGFVISLRHGLIIPAATVAKWHDRFPHIPDLEAQMSGLATTILRKGPQHPGWTCPEGWMIKPLANINEEARANKQTAALKAAKSGAPSRRREIDVA
jgi:hypothetical protein